MALKLNLVLISAMYILCIQIIDTDARCHLDHMKNFALNSCEMLIEAMDSDFANPHDERLKREILEARNSTGSHYDESRHIRPTHLRMKNRSFPARGYIVLDRLYAKILRQVHPSIFHFIPRTQYSEDDTSQRHHYDDNKLSNEVPYRRRKRHHGDAKDEDTINITYCCANKCRHYDLCEL